MIEIKVKPQHGKGPGINIHGKHVTESVHQIFSRVMAANHIHSPFYKARTKCSAFFQGGYDAPKDNWVFIEFWGSDYMDFVQIIRKYINYLDNAGNPLPITYSFPIERRSEAEDIHHYVLRGKYCHNEDGTITLYPEDGDDVMDLVDSLERSGFVINCTKIVIDPYEWEEKGALGVFEMITEDTSVPYIWKLGDKLRFLPVNEEQKTAVADLLGLFKIAYVFQKFADE
ncbi:hypothetical protein MZD04_gp357 [Pseudomonas phage Psa21]|uniref:Uncharacterized protein n=1 Tax=Pseudomonas phage Psa21 TaxID=2530023 RepID=A0A481W666_9CAUD|nr:hypothetical protein MZD04_gp357 [Pseudomonas phage Psa21]QBJ02883.1 hypothetical protein PSA21_357 [Pseudomonas phage Psa21]